MIFSSAAKAILRAVVQGGTLRVHRNMDGDKVYRLHTLNGQTQSVSAKHVRSLERQGYLTNNKKFPVSTFWLSEKGKLWGRKAGILDDNADGPLTSRWD